MLLPVSCLSPSAPEPAHWQSYNQGLIPHTPVTAVVFDPGQSNRLTVTAYDPVALYHSEDNGKIWRADDTFGHPIHVLRIDAQRPGVRLAGSADGLHRALWADGRWQWTDVAAWPTSRAVFALIQDEHGTFYLGGESSLDQPPVLWRSREGETWEPLPPLPVPPGNAILSVAISDGVLLAGTDGYGLFRSVDGGERWQPAEEIGPTFVAVLWVAPWDMDLVLARTREGLFRSTDGGEHWGRIAGDLEGRPDALTATLDGAILLGMSTGQIWRSEDGGVDWQLWGALDRDGMINTLAVDPNDAQIVYAGTQYGLYRSEDSGRTWSPVATVGHYQATALAQSSDGILYLGNEDGVYRTTHDGEIWQSLAEGLPPRTVRALAVVPGDPPILFAGTDAGLYRSLEGGSSWQLIGWEEQSIPGVVSDPEDPNRLYVRLAFERIYSTDEALAANPSNITWTARWQGMATTSEILSMAIDPHATNRLYAGGAVDFFVSEDRAATWRAIVSELAGQSLFVVAVDPWQAGRIYAGATNGVYRSEDGGEHWTPLGLPTMTVSALAFHPAHPNLLYVGTRNRGVYRSEDGGESWQPAGLENNSIASLHISPDGEWLYAATDRGFWRRDEKVGN